ncbi:ricin-type beta-trefoil lectin domain protein [Jidongwangia harbinensis]|uniref:ricin-type beta-trefoil lectin domain protein n=1 Tax=Jidongwangia harbinensis TaxID=2878561 RepID=UPI001CD9268E|nr:ricin-type beta-trefoil lectin domain protein [Jidongwangia harbinensis]MCA2216424.1 ricin-type beta-trefoil lectin domain protein [Jidongwangia harbinensis]
MNRIYQAITVAAVAAVTVTLTPTVSSAGPGAPAAPPAAAGGTLDLAPGMLAAMRRDLGLDDDRIAARLRVEAAAPVVESRLRARLGGAFAGAWIPAGGDRLTVAVTTRAAADRVRAEGADARIVARGEKELTAARAAMDRRGAEAGPDIRGWYVDVDTNSVVVQVRPGAEEAARRFARDSGSGPVVVEAAAQPRPMYDIRGGDQYVINGNTLCSVGFSVAGGFVTAGHCGGTGSPTLGHNNVSQGTFAGSSFPGNDYGWVRTNGNWTPQPWVNNYSGGNVTVAGSAEAAIGSSICRSGRTTGWRCGTLQGRDHTVNYPQGAVSGLGRSNACAEPGDSGGSWITGNQAQGVTSGGSGNCSTGGTMYFQPVNEILGVYGLSLTTTGGGSSTSAIVSNWHNKCVDVPNGNYADGQRLIVWNCTGAANQRWEWVNGTLRTQNNMCMDVAWGSTANGAAVQIATCSGNPAQQFVLSAAGDLVNPQANKCVDIAEWNPENDAVLHLWECVGGANQKWRRG